MSWGGGVDSPKMYFDGSEPQFQPPKTIQDDHLSMSTIMPEKEQENQEKEPPPKSTRKNFITEFYFGTLTRW